MGNRTQRQKAAGAPADQQGFSLISNQKLLDLYAGLVKLRRPRKTAGAGADGRNQFKGQEAAAIAVSIDLKDGDRLTVLRDGELLPLSPSQNGMVQFAAKPRGNGARAKTARTRTGVDAGRGAVETVLGAALLQKAEREGAISVVLVQSGRAEEWEQGLKVAAAHNLPLILVRPQSLASAVQEQPGKRVRRGSPSATEPYLPFIPVDSNDVVAIYRVAFEAMGRARTGRGPTVIDCLPFQLQGTPDKAAKRKTAGDPVAAMEQYLQGKGLLKSGTKPGRTPGLSRRRSG